MQDVVEEIIKSRDVLSAITGCSMAAAEHGSGEQATKTSREDVRNACESVKLDAAKRAILTDVFFIIA